MEHYYKPVDLFQSDEDENFSISESLKGFYKNSIFYKNKEKQDEFKILLKNFYQVEKFDELTIDQYLKLKRFLIKNVDTGRLF